MGEQAGKPGIWLGTYRRLIAKGHDQSSAAYEADLAEKRQQRARVAAEYRLCASPHEWTDEDSKAMAHYVFDAESALDATFGAKAKQGPVNCFGIPDRFNGWEITQGPDDRFYANMERSADTWDELKDDLLACPSSGITQGRKG